MATYVGPKTLSVALLGNPNTGKSTLFTAICGVRQRTGNYPGVTVEKKVGRVQHGDVDLEIIDLPGTYSLAPRSPDEMVAVDVLLGRRSDTPRPDVIVCIVDASNLDRNLYLVSQILELELPVVIALNMVDVAQSRGITIDTAALSTRLQLPVVSLQANRGIGVDQLRDAIVAASEQQQSVESCTFPTPFQKEVQTLQTLAPEVPRYLLERLLLDTSGYLLDAQLSGISASLPDEVLAARRRLAGTPSAVPGVEAIARYKWVAKLLAGVVTKETNRSESFSDRIDRVLTHWFAGSAVFLLIMSAMFLSVFYVAEPAAAAVDWLVGTLNEFVASNMSEGPLRSLITSGVISGVGGVVVFLPQILVLFFFIGVLEDCGYMARAAYLMDRLMSRVGLSGKSFIPLLSSFACAIPGIMGTRVIENPRDRLVTILIAPLMSCSARLPVYSLLIAAFFPANVLIRATVMMSMYLIGIVAAVVVALVLKRTILRGKPSPFVLELPMYKMPSLRLVLLRMFERGWAFIKNAGSLILAISILVWAAAYYPHRDEAVPAELLDRKARLEQTPPAVAPEEHAAAITDVENEIAGAYLRDSYLGRAGQAIEPIVRPLGWDWRIGCAAIASFPAREVIVATLGTIFNLGDGVDEETSSLHATLQNATWPDGRPLITMPVALSIMVFFSLCAQCAATLATIRRETNSWFWPAFTFVYMTTLAYVAAFVTFQVGSRIL